MALWLRLFQRGRDPVHVGYCVRTFRGDVALPNPNLEWRRTAWSQPDGHTAPLLRKLTVRFALVET